MDPKENDHLNSPKTPIKIRPPLYLSGELRFIISQERPRKFDFVDQILQDRSEQDLLFLSNEKESSSNSEQNSISQHSIYSNDGASEPQQPEEENFQTVKKVFEPKLTSINTLIETTAKINTKGCNCDKSKCLKNYCVCYKTGNKCSDECQCIDCQNIKITSQHLKNEKIALQFMSNTKFKGCNCKNSGCLKKYCICHQHGRKCSQICRCQNCHNTEGNEKDNFEDERGVRLIFTARKKIKVSEFGYGDVEQNIQIEG